MYQWKYDFVELDKGGGVGFITSSAAVPSLWPFNFFISSLICFIHIFILITLPWKFRPCKSAANTLKNHTVYTLKVIQ